MAKAARRIPMTVTFLEMNVRPTALPPPQPRGKIALLKCENPPPHFYRYLYDTIGADYYWVDRKKLSPEKLGIFFGVFFNDLCCAVGRGVVVNEDFHRKGCLLHEKPLDGLPDEILMVVCDANHTHHRHRPLRPDLLGDAQRFF